jgi:hypothetical protein
MKQDMKHTDTKAVTMVRVTEQAAQILADLVSQTGNAKRFLASEAILRYAKQIATTK